MTPAEYIELIIMSRDSIGMNSMNVVALFTAYVVAMYAVASKLSKTQHAILATSYTVFYVAPAMTALNGIAQIFGLGAAFFEDYPEEASRVFNSGPLVGASAYSIPLLAIFIGAWAGSIYFAYSMSRKEK